METLFSLSSQKRTFMHLIQVLLSYLTQQNELLDCLTVQANRYIISCAVWTSGELNLVDIVQLSAGSKVLVLFLQLY